MTKQPHHHEQFRVGRDRLARAVTLLLVRNDLSHQDLEDLAAWATPEADGDRWLQKSQVSSLRNSKVPKPGAQVLLALANTNRALAELARGVASDRPPLPRNLRHLGEGSPFWLAHHSTGEPLTPGDWFEILIGLYASDELGDGAQPFSDQTAAIASEQFALLVSDWQNREAIRLPALRQALEATYPEKDPQRRELLWRVAIGERRWTGAQLSEERDALRFTIGRLEDRPALTPRELDQWVRAGA